jgi:hypothetical protein
MLSSQRMLSLRSIGMRVGLTFLLSALVPLNFFLVQNFTAARPSGGPSAVTARLACINSPQTVCMRKRPFLSLPLLTRQVRPTRSGRRLR